MPIDLVDYETKAREAVQAFWGNHEMARQKQIDAGRVDIGERAGVKAGKHMHGFLDLILDLVRANGLGHAAIHQQRAVLTLPGYFRPTKIWDLLIINQGRLVAALELKSQVGPSFGNNANNRAKEAIVTAHDFWRAYREGAFGKQSRPFVGWLMLLEDVPNSRRLVKKSSLYFPIAPDFQGASYQQRYDLLCQRLVQEQLYTVASVITSPRTAVANGEYHELSEMTSLHTFATSFAGYIAAEAAR
jgi:hypothetical protein